MEGKPRMPRVEKLLLTSPETAVTKVKTIQLPLNIFSDFCSNPMDGQTLTLTEIPSFPQAILPNVLNNKFISGYSVNMFLLYAKHFKFRPKITFTGGGTYMAHNESFSPGKFHDVSTLYDSL